MERSVIDYIFETDKSINEEVYKNNDFREAMERMLRIYKRLNETLSDGQKNDLEKYIGNEAELEDIRERTSFRCGVKYGLRLAVECMRDI